MNEIKEILIQVYAYARFPRSLNALGKFLSLLKERKADGVVDIKGKESSPFPKSDQSLKDGT